MKAVDVFTEKRGGSPSLSGSFVHAELCAIKRCLERLKRLKDGESVDVGKSPRTRHVLSINASMSDDGQFWFSYDWELIFDAAQRRSCIYSVSESLKDSKFTGCETESMLDRMDVEDQKIWARNILKGDGK